MDPSWSKNAQIFKSERQDHRVVSCKTQTQTTSPSGVIGSAWFEKVGYLQDFHDDSGFQLRLVHMAAEGYFFADKSN